MYRIFASVPNSGPNSVFVFGHTVSSEQIRIVSLYSAASDVYGRLNSVSASCSRSDRLIMGDEWRGESHGYAGTAVVSERYEVVISEQQEQCENAQPPTLFVFVFLFSRIWLVFGRIRIRIALVAEPFDTAPAVLIFTTSLCPSLITAVPACCLAMTLTPSFVSHNQAVWARAAGTDWVKTAVSRH